MKITKIVCDKCGKNIEGTSIKIVPDVSGPDITAATRKIFQKQLNNDYCVPCTEEIFAHINAIPESEELPRLENEGPTSSENVNDSSSYETVKKQSKVKTITVRGNGGKSVKIDLAKMFALKNAKWKNREIAEEFGVEEKQIVNYLYRYKDRVEIST